MDLRVFFYRKFVVGQGERKEYCERISLKK